MTVTTTKAYTVYTGDGVRRLFTFGFDKVVGALYGGFVNGEAVGFTIQSNGIVFDEAPPEGAYVFIFRLSPISQLRDWRAFGPFQAFKTEDAMDLLISLKQEAVGFRAKCNLVTIRDIERVIIGNDKGEYAYIKIWDNELAGCFAGSLDPAIPRDAAFTPRANNYAFMQYDSKPTRPFGPEFYSDLISWVDAADLTTMVKENGDTLADAGGTDFRYWVDKAYRRRCVYWGDPAQGDSLRYALPSLGTNPGVTIVPGKLDYGYYSRDENGTAIRILESKIEEDDVTMIAVARSLTDGTWYVTSTVNNNSPFAGGGYAVRLERIPTGSSPGYGAGDDRSFWRAREASPLSDNAPHLVAIRGTGFNGSIDGWVDNTYTGNRDLSTFIKKPMFVPYSKTPACLFMPPDTFAQVEPHAGNLFILERVIYKRALPDNEMDRLLRYFREKYGIANA